MMQCQSYLGNPQFQYYDFMGCPQPNYPVMWQQWPEGWNPNGLYYCPGNPAIKPGQLVSPSKTPLNEISELRMADGVEFVANPPLPPGDGRDSENGDQVDGVPPLVYNDDQPSPTIADTLNFYARYYAYQDYQNLRGSLCEPVEQTGNDESPMDTSSPPPLPPDLPEDAYVPPPPPPEDTDSVFEPRSVSDIPLPPEQSPAERNCIILQSPKKSKLKKLRSKQRKQSNKKAESKQQEDLSRSDSPKLEQSTLEPGEIEESDTDCV